MLTEEQCELVSLISSRWMFRLPYCYSALRIVFLGMMAVYLLKVWSLSVKVFLLKEPFDLRAIAVCGSSSSLVIYLASSGVLLICFYPTLWYPMKGSVAFRKLNWSWLIPFYLLVDSSPEVSVYASSASWSVTSIFGGLLVRTPLWLKALSK